VWTRAILERLGHKQAEPTTLWCDNAAARLLVENPVYHRRTKHIDVKFFYTREKFEDGELQVQQIGTLDQLADFLTKPLTSVKLHKNLVGIGIVE
jgi:hypothetical protein